MTHSLDVKGKATWAKMGKMEETILKKMWDGTIKCDGQGRVLQIESRLCQHA